MDRILPISTIRLSLSNQDKKEKHRQIGLAAYLSGASFKASAIASGEE